MMLTRRILFCIILLFILLNANANGQNNTTYNYNFLAKVNDFEIFLNQGNAYAISTELSDDKIKSISSFSIKHDDKIELINLNDSTSLSGYPKLRVKRIIGAIGTYKFDGESWWSFIKVGFEKIKSKKNTKSDLEKLKGIGVATSGYLDFYSDYSSYSGLISLSKYYLSFYSFVQYDYKSFAGVLSGGPAINLTTGNLNFDEASASFVSFGLHFSEGVQLYTKPQGEFFIRLGWDQYIMLKGGFVSSFSINLGF